MRGGEGDAKEEGRGGQEGGKGGGGVRKGEGEGVAGGREPAAGFHSNFSSHLGTGHIHIHKGERTCSRTAHLHYMEAGMVVGGYNMSSKHPLVGSTNCTALYPDE